MVIRHAFRYVFDSPLFLGIVGAVSNAIIAGFSILIWRVYRNQLATMRDALTETRESNTATKESNKIAERSILLGGRSWVVTHGNPGWSNKESGWAFDGVSVVNLSDTPALLKQTSVGYLDRKVAKNYTELLPSDGWYDHHGEVVVRNRPINPFGPSYPVIGRPQSDATSLVNATLYCIVEYTDCFEKTWRTTIAWQEGPDETWEALPDYTSLR